MSLNTENDLLWRRHTHDGVFTTDQYLLVDDALSKLRVSNVD